MSLKARSLLDSIDAAAYLTTNVVDIAYATGVRAGDAALIARPGGFALFVDGRYVEAAKRDAKKGIAVRHVSAFDAFMRKISACGFDPEEASVARLKRWRKRFASTTFSSVDNLFFEARRVKTDDEKRKLKRALRITDGMLERVPSILKNGVTEREIAWKLECMAHDAGAEKLSFDAIVAFGSHASSPHHHPTSRRFKKGHLVQIDVGAMFEGYCGDRSEVFFTKRPTDEESFAYAAVKEAKDAAKKAMRAGVPAAKPDEIARDVLKRHGLHTHFTHALGHGVGLEIHEGVTISSKSTMTLLSGEVVTAEPGVYFPGRFGMRLEDMVFIG